MTLHTRTLVVAVVLGTGAAFWLQRPIRAGEQNRTGQANAPATAISRTFEFRAVSGDARATGETDFKGETATLTTDERVAFLQAYADYASAWFKDPKLDQLAVSPAEISQQLATLTPQPLPSVRKTIPLNDGWKQVSFTRLPEDEVTASPVLPVAPNGTLSGEELHLPSGTSEIAASQDWRFELRWEAQGGSAAHPVRWRLAHALLPASTEQSVPGWHTFRLRVDRDQRRASVWRDGDLVAGVDVPVPDTGLVPFEVVTDGPVAIRRLVQIGYNRTADVRRPISVSGMRRTPLVKPARMSGWTTSAYDDRNWQAATLPCAHGGFLETDEDLYLRRTVELPAARRVLLDLEALDPSGEIYVNGQLAASIPNRLPIRLDITKWAKAGSNLIALKVHHNWIDDPVFHATIDPATGWFAGRATLHLIGADVSIKEMLVHTASLPPSGSAGAARQAHRIAVENSGATPFEGIVAVAYRRWFPQAGPVVVTKSFPIRLGPGASDVVTAEVDVPDPRAWSPGSPQLYAVTATLQDSTGHALDDHVATTGIRTISQQSGSLLINGSPALLIGAQNMGFRVYPDYENGAKFNRSAPAERLMAEMLAIKKMGGNLLRIHVHSANNSTGSINDPRIAEFADQLGLALFWSGPAWVRQGDERTIDTSHEADYIRQVYNHPSIVNWELSNHPNSFKQDDGPERTHDFVRKTVQSVLAIDQSRLISPTTFWEQTHYGNDFGTIDHKKRPITPVPEYTHPLVTRGSQDSITGYGSEWTKLRKWPVGLVADTLKNGVRAWMNFEHEESGAQPNWNLSGGMPWHRVRSYEAPYEEGSIGRVLTFDEWRASQGWQAFSAYESMKKQLWHGVTAFSWCTIEGGANGGTYEKPLLDPMGHAKLAWHVHKLLSQPVLAGTADVDTVYGPGDVIATRILNIGPARTVALTITIKTPDGRQVDRKTFSGVALQGGRSVTTLAGFKPTLPPSGFVVVEYEVRSEAAGR